MRGGAKYEKEGLWLSSNIHSSLNSYKNGKNIAYPNHGRLQNKFGKLAEHFISKVFFN
jgi:hypothetical protein